MAAIEDQVRIVARKLEKANGSLPVLNKGCPEWDVWHAWRFRHGLSNRFWASLDRVTVPLELPPENLDEALKTAGAGQLSERLVG